VDLVHGQAKPALVYACIFLCVAAPPGGCRRDSATTVQDDRPEHRPHTSYFTDITDEVGLDFSHVDGADGSLWMAEMMGSGVALFDFDNDSDLDIYLTNGHRGLGTREISHGPVNRLYRREHDGRFTDVTGESGLGDRGYGMGVAVADIDNDGYVDVYVTNLGHDRLYRNRGDGTFENVTKSSGIEVDDWSSSASFFDYDRDGYLDLYVTKYVKWDPDTKCISHIGTRDYCGPLAYRPAHDNLLHNNGDGTFTDVTELAGIASTAAAGLGVVCEDLNDDGWVDVYVANDAYANNFWINQKDGTFRDDALVMGVAYNMHGLPEAGMGVVAADFDNDGDADLFMTHLLRETNTLYRNDGPLGGFIDVTGEAGLGFTSAAYTGFGTAAFDLELDGDLDLFVVNGRVYQNVPLPNATLPAPWNGLAEPNLLYLNKRNARFELAGEGATSLCGPVEITRGLATGDIDNDGDIDLLIGNIRSSPRLYRNDAPREGRWLIARAIDPRLRRDAIGARVAVTSGKRRFTRTISSGFSYVSSSDPRAHFGLGAIDKVDSLDVQWPDGLRERFHGRRVNRHVELVRGTGEKVDYEPTQTESVAASADNKHR
jgi:hypothetical protein